MLEAWSAEGRRRHRVLPAAADPVLGVWAHRQALAARYAGAEVRVLVLHRPALLRRAALARPARARRAAAPAAAHGARRHRGPLRAVRGPAAPPHVRPLGRVGGADARPRPAAAAPPLPVRPRARPLRRSGGRRGPPRRPGVPVVVSVHGGDVLAVAESSPAGAAAVRAGLGHARPRARQLPRHRRALPRRSARRDVRVVHLGTDLPPAPPDRRPDTLVTVAHLVARKRHADVLRALWPLRDRHPEAPLRRRRRRPRARPRSSGSPRSSASPPGSASTASSRPRPRARPLRRPASSSSPASTRRSASPTWRRWRAACRRSAAAGSRARRRSPPWAGPAARAARGPGGARGGDRRARRRARPAASSAGRPGDRERTSPGSAAAGRPSRPTRTPLR